MFQVAGIGCFFCSRITDQTFNKPAGNFPIHTQAVLGVIGGVNIFLTQKFMLGVCVRNITQHHDPVFRQGGVIVFVNTFQRTDARGSVSRRIVFIFGVVVAAEHCIQRQAEGAAGLELHRRGSAPLFLMI